MNPAIDPATLLPGDVLLMKGIGPVSDLIAWFGDSTYSHAAIVVDGGDLIEAAAPVSRRAGIAGRLTQGAFYDFIDAWRPTRADGYVLSASDRAAAAASATALLDIAFPLDAMVQMAIVAALRDRLPIDPTAKRIIRAVIDHVLEDEPDHTICSELVFRALRDAAATPDAALAPAVIIAAPLDLPFPRIDWVALWQEWEETRRRRPALPDLAVAAARAGAGDTDEDSALKQRFAALRTARGLRSRSGALAAMREPRGSPTRVVVEPDPDPRNVLPIDLETSVSLRLLGRLPLSIAR